MVSTLSSGCAKVIEGEPKLSRESRSLHKGRDGANQKKEIRNVSDAQFQAMVQGAGIYEVFQLYIYHREQLEKWKHIKIKRREKASGIG